MPCGATAASGTLFNVAVKKAPGPDGVGTVTVAAVTLRDCSNAPIAATAGGSATVTINRTAPDVTLDSPNGGETLDIGATHDVTWSASDPEGVTSVQMHDGSTIRFTTLPTDYDPTDRQKVYNYLLDQQGEGNVVTGLLYVNESAPDMHELANSSELPMSQIPFEALCPGAAALAKINASFR